MQSQQMLKFFTTAVDHWMVDVMVTKRLGLQQAISHDANEGFKLVTNRRCKSLKTSPTFLLLALFRFCRTKMRTLTHYLLTGEHTYFFPNA